MPNLNDFAAKFGVDTSRPHFPVNSLRLLYFMIADSYAPNNQKLISRIEQGIPLVEAAAAADSTAEARAALVSAVGTSSFALALQSFQTGLIPLQTAILAVLYRDFSHDGPLDESHLHLLLKARAIDASVFAAVLAELIRQEAGLDEQTFADLLKDLQTDLPQVYQLNDLVDSVVFARTDIEHDNFSPLQLIRKIAPQPQDTKGVILQYLEKAFVPKNLLINEFVSSLSKMLSS